MSSANNVVTTTPETCSAERLTGRVKWFNNKAGYGFITITDGDRTGTDIFVHHSAVCVSNQQYKYLVQGEYIEFGLVKVENSTHEFQAAEVGGIKGGKLMCETRREYKMARTTYKTSEGEEIEETEPIKMPRQPRPPRQNAEQSSESKSSTVVSKGSKPSVPTPLEMQQTAKPGRGRGRPPRTN